MNGLGGLRVRLPCSLGLPFFSSVDPDESVEVDKDDSVVVVPPFIADELISWCREDCWCLLLLACLLLPPDLLFTLLE